MNQETFQHTVFIYKDKLYRFAKRFLDQPEDAYDLVQEVMLKLWEQRAQLQKLHNIEAYSMQMIRNMAYNKLDKMGRGHQYLLQLPTEFEEAQYPALTRELILHLIDKLPEKQRMVMHLRDIEEYEIADIAAITALEENAVRVNLSRARTTVRTYLTKVFDYEKRRIG